MWFHIDESSGTPIYRQIIDQVKQGVASGVLRPGDRLPGTRDLAIDLTLNPNTVVKAYQELARAGVIDNSRGRGAFIAKGISELPHEMRLRELDDVIRRLAAEAYRLRIDDDTVIELVKNRLKESAGRRAAFVEMTEHE